VIPDAGGTAARFDFQCRMLERGCEQVQARHVETSRELDVFRNDRAHLDDGFDRRRLPPEPVHPLGLQETELRSPVATTCPLLGLANLLAWPALGLGVLG
jgi:hypothetical protein